ncbi:DUF3465 domain-containing protein [Acinetobacter towneri]|uniref:DUF3465 domain-containing protein n=1 Tax=Acinetobacter towneri TaxID=202956 RepID=UPI0029344631|nr:DUF3465 domain-containing protein [Acinetobacter towneri]MDV2454695.1 DUF3465 domain-containing protein [Acinetobacter towneri]WOE29679.1 DUF3465 domain-containing protein [Acinetobacter towneri]
MANKKNLSIGAIIVVLIAAFFGIDLPQFQSETSSAPTTSTARTSQDEKEQLDVQRDTLQDDAQGVQLIERAFERKQSDLQVRASGQVIAVLADDNEGSRHQKFILKLNNGQTVLVAHNIDLAPRITNIAKGDTVEFFGEYEYSDKGGVIHWTHHDPANKHVGGWLKHQGRTYQ